MMRLALLGRTLGHSLSPAIHKRYLSALGLTGTYELRETEPEQVAETMADFRARYDGVNVTIPYKEKVIPFLDSLSPEAKEIGAVNTISFHHGEAVGYNTDCTGFGRALRHAGIFVKGASCTLIGAGGAARAVIQWFRQEGAASITVLSRHPETVGADFLTMAEKGVLSLRSLSEWEAAEEGGDLLVNATPAGMFPNAEGIPVEEENIRRFAAAADLIYNPGATRFLKAAKEGGARTMNGLYMLAAQAAEAETIWTGRAVPDALVEAICRELETMV